MKPSRFNLVKFEKDTGLYIYSVDVTEAHTETLGDEFSNDVELMLSLDYGSNEHTVLYPVWAEFTAGSKVWFTVLFALDYELKQEKI
jgi:hypothetical protein